MSGQWLDLTTQASAYEIAFNPYTRQYRHRIRHIIPSEDPAILIVRAIAAADWAPGMPPPYQT